jgi:hypothetical protein
MLDFNKINKSILAIVPIKNNYFVYNRKHYKMKMEIEDGWYDVEIFGNEIKKYSASSPSIKKNSTMKGYTYNNNFIPNNFDVLKKKYGYEVITNLYFNNLQSMSAIEAIVWEDNQFYFYQQDFTNMIIFEIQNCIDEEGNISINKTKGITPEIKTLLLFHSIERKNQIELKRKLENKKRIEEYKKSMPERLLLSFQGVDAEVINYSTQGKKLIVDWSFKNNRQQFNSVIDIETFKILEAGYCMSGDDFRHNIKSMVLTAKSYDEDGLIHITRRN